MKKLANLLLALLLLTTACTKSEPKICQPKEIDPLGIAFVNPAATTITAVVYDDPLNPGNRLSHPGDSQQLTILRALFADLSLTVLSKEEQQAWPDVTVKNKAALELNFDAGDALFFYSSGHLTIYLSNGCEKLPFTYSLSPDTVKLLLLSFNQQ